MILKHFEGLKTMYNNSTGDFYIIFNGKGDFHILLSTKEL